MNESGFLSGSGCRIRKRDVVKLGVGSLLGINMMLVRKGILDDGQGTKGVGF